MLLEHKPRLLTRARSVAGIADAARAQAAIVGLCSACATNLRSCSAFSPGTGLGAEQERKFLPAVEQEPRFLACARAELEIPAAYRAASNILGLCSSTTVDSCRESSRGRNRGLRLSTNVDSRRDSRATQQSRLPSDRRRATRSPGCASARLPAPDRAKKRRSVRLVRVGDEMPHTKACKSPVHRRSIAMEYYLRIVKAHRTTSFCHLNLEKRLRRTERRFLTVATCRVALATKQPGTFVSSGGCAASRLKDTEARTKNAPACGSMARKHVERKGRT